jgi:hypothetical protein
MKSCPFNHSFFSVDYCIRALASYGEADRPPDLSRCVLCLLQQMKKMQEAVDRLIRERA